MARKQTDNSNLAAKLELRRYFLDKYHAADPPGVLDCCQGDGLLWKRLQSEYTLASYWGVDLKVKRGRLKLDSVRILCQPGWPQTVVDVDTYGSPWKHYHALLETLAHPVTVFLTIGQWQMGTDSLILDALGLGELDVPPGIAIKLHDLALVRLLTAGESRGVRVVEALETIGTGHASARYVGVRLEIFDG